VWHILYRKLLLLLLMIGNRFLKNRFHLFINFCHRRTNNRCCSHRYRRIYNGLCNHIALHHGCNSSWYREKRFCDHQNGHTDPLLLKLYLLRYHAPPYHFILYKNNVSCLQDLDVFIRTVEMEPLRLIWIANKMTTYSLRVQLSNTWVK
jgi:hypothetical protein